MDQQQSAAAADREAWSPWARHKMGKVTKKLMKEFDGSRGYNGRWFRRPTRLRTDCEPPVDPKYALPKFEYRNQYGHPYKKARDVETYLSTTKYVPSRLLVQVTDDVYKSKQPFHDTWRRTKMTGQTPVVLRLAEWAVGSRPGEHGEYPKKAWYTGINQIMRIILVALPLQLLLSVPIVAHPWEDDDVEGQYLEWPGYH